MLATLGLGAGCSSDAEKLDCAWLAGENCYKRAVRAVSECAPGSEATGTFDASRTTCTYTDGTTVTFEEPVPDDPVDDDYRWRFDVEGPDGACARFEETNSGFELTAPSGTVRAVGSFSSFKMHCADGTTYSSGDPFSLFECEQDSAVFPGTTSLGGAGGFVSFGLMAPDGVDGTLVRCE